MSDLKFSRVNIEHPTEGHLVYGVGNGTDPDSIVWADYCRRCGAKLSAPVSAGSTERKA